MLYVSSVTPGGGSYSYVLIKPSSSLMEEIAIHHSYPSDMNLKEGQWLKVGVDAICGGLPVNTYGHRTCTARSIRIDDVQYTSIGKQ